MTNEDLSTIAFLREVWCHRCEGRWGDDCATCITLVRTCEPPMFEERIIVGNTLGNTIEKIDTKDVASERE